MGKHRDGTWPYTSIMSHHSLIMEASFLALIKSLLFFEKDYSPSHSNLGRCRVTVDSA
jgi:hypothetical protein